jgi:hypothetical protein
MLNLIRTVLGIHHHRFNLSVKCSSIPLVEPEVKKIAKKRSQLQGAQRRRQVRASVR